MSDFFTALLALALAASGVSCFITALTAHRLAELSAQVKACDPSRMESFARSLLEVQEALNELATSVRMSKVRRAALPIEKRESADELPDPYKHPDAWRDAVNGRLGRAMIPK